LDELREILTAVGDAMRDEGYIDRIYMNRDGLWGHLQLWLPDWPQPACSAIHFEVGFDRQDLSDDRMFIALDVEDSVPDKQAVIDCIQRLLKPYQFTDLLLRSTGTRFVSDSAWHVLHLFSPLTAVSSQELASACRRLRPITVSVDEALFVCRGVPLWRTDFFTSDPQPTLSWGDNAGGQRVQRRHGLMDSPSLLVDGSAPGNHDPADGCPAHIAKLTFTHEIKNGNEIYLSCVLKTTKGGRLWFIGDVPSEKHGVVALFDSPHWLEIPVTGMPTWQHIGFKARVRTPDDIDFAAVGAAIYIRTQTDDPEFLFNSIEFGRCGG
jgi:hypothetical protein